MKIVKRETSGLKPSFMLFVELRAAGRLAGLRGYCPPGPRQTWTVAGGWVE